MATSHDLLRVDRLRKTFYGGPDPKTVLNNVSFTLSTGDSLAVVGPSGCGKTTLLLIVAGLLTPSEGGVWLQGAAVKEPSKNVALVLQHYGLFPWKTVAANITLGSDLQKMDVTKDDVADLKKELGIEGLDHLYPRQLSGGQRQRVALARAILLKPSLLLLDEPFAAIDTITRERLQTGLLSIFAQRRFSFIIVTHSFEEAIYLGKRILVLDNEAHVLAMLENPQAGTPDFPSSQEFFTRTLELRHILEDSQ
jgi:NitT/TauT family transport system ATP-binding protein